jgi:DNA-binding transcriptional regulator YdaS (Cro superfamily)
MDALRSYFESGKSTQKELATRLGIKQPSVAKWLKEGRVPPKRVRDVEAVTGIPAAKLCPEIFGKRRPS